MIAVLAAAADWLHPTSFAVAGLMVTLAIRRTHKLVGLATTHRLLGHALALALAGVALLTVLEDAAVVEPRSARIAGELLTIVAALGYIFGAASALTENRSLAAAVTRARRELSEPLPPVGGDPWH